MAKSSVSIIPANGGGRSVYFDVVTSVGLTRSKTVTKSPVSTGTPINDNTTKFGDIITLECKVTNTPLVAYDGNMIKNDDNESRIYSAYDVVKNIFNTDTLCTIVHKFDTHTNMMLVEESPIILPSNSVGFRLKFQKVRYVGEQRIELVTNMSAVKAKDAAANKQSGSSSGTSSGKKEVDNKYLLDDVFNSTIEQGSDIFPDSPTTEVTP